MVHHYSRRHLRFSLSHRSVNKISFLLAFFLLLVLVLPRNALVIVQAQGTATAVNHESDNHDNYMDEYVREVLQEDQENHADQNPHDNPYSTEEDFERHQQETQRRQEQEAERQRQLAQEAAKRRAQEREAAFERKVQKLDQEAQKKARQKKRRDAKLVTRLLDAFQRNDYYAVLGLGRRHWVTLQSIPKILPSWIQRILRPGWSTISASDIKKAYRTMATRIHPDKNHDGRAEQAFVALDEAYQVLSDPTQRQDYDRVWQDQTQEEWIQRQGHVLRAVHATKQVLDQSVTVVRRVVGPFALPLGILGLVFL